MRRSLAASQRAKFAAAHERPGAGAAPPGATQVRGHRGRARFLDAPLFSQIPLGAAADPFDLGNLDPPALKVKRRGSLGGSRRRSWSRSSGVSSRSLPRLISNQRSRSESFPITYKADAVNTRVLRRAHVQKVNHWRSPDRATSGYRLPWTCPRPRPGVVPARANSGTFLCPAQVAVCRFCRYSRSCKRLRPTLRDSARLAQTRGTALPGCPPLSFSFFPRGRREGTGAGLAAVGVSQRLRT